MVQWLVGPPCVAPAAQYIRLWRGVVSARTLPSMGTAGISTAGGEHHNTFKVARGQLTVSLLVGWWAGQWQRCVWTPGLLV
jgi:hypothetical protein